MSLPRYPEYKASGVEWLGEVPGHWDIRKIRWLCEIKKRISGELGHDVLSITQQGIKIKDLESNDGQISMDYSKYQFVEVGDFAMNHMDLLTGYVDISDVPGVTSPDYRVFSIRDKKDCYDRYVLYLFQMGYRNKIFYAFGQGSSQFGRWRLPTEQFKDFFFPLPPIEEQQTIAAFLDRETGKIDALIAEQQRLVELLAEKRQAVISHAVTKGLNPIRHSGESRNPAEKTVPRSGQSDCPAAQEFSNDLDSGFRRNDGVVMKDSGIEWLGEVPEHWDVRRLKHALRLLTDKTDRRENPVALENIQGWSGRFILTETEFEGEGVAFVRGDILFGKLRPYLAKVYLAESPGEAVGDFHVLRPEPKMVGRFVIYQMLNRNFITIVDSSTFGAKMPRVSWDFMSNMMLAIPPKDEQQAIADFLDTEIAKFDTLTGEANRAIALLQERRSALISAAVTGKIDVRGVVIPAQAGIQQDYVSA